MRFRIVKVNDVMFMVEKKKFIGWEEVASEPSLATAKLWIKVYEDMYKARMNPEVVYEKVIKEEWM